MPPRPPLLLLDFDGTLTLSSTIPLLLSLSSLPPSTLSPFTTAYTTSLQNHTSRYHPKKESRKTVAGELAYLASLEPIEKQSIERLEDAGIWKGVSRERVEDVAKGAVRDGEVVLRRGWGGLVGDVQGERGGKVGIVSVGWSRGFIGACLREGGGKENGRGCGGGDGDSVEVEVEVEVGDIDILANELVFDEEGRGTGKLDRYFPSSSSSSSSSSSEEEGTGIWTAASKLLIMHSLISQRTHEMGGVRPWVIYIGDSATDLGCLMDADVGVCVRDDEVGETGEQGALREGLERCGVRCEWIGGWKGRGEGKGKGVWWARDFEEVRRGILE